jgi:hypothetical protein
MRMAEVVGEVGDVMPLDRSSFSRAEMASWRTVSQ